MKIPAATGKTVRITEDIDDVDYQRFRGIKRLRERDRDKRRDKSMVSALR